MIFSDKYKDSDIMIVSGGPSTNDVAWENLNCDYIWSCNQFYQNQKLKNRKVDLVILGNTVDFNSSELKERLKKDNTTICIEPVHIRKTHTDEFLNFKKDFISNMINIEIPYRSMDGVGIRLALMAISEGAKNVYIVGHDGYSKDMKAVHSFQGHDGLREGATHTDYNKWYDAILNSFELVHSLATEKKCNVFNLGEGHDKNIGTIVSKIKFPLPESIKRRI